MAENPRRSALSALAGFVIADATIGETLQRVATIAVDAIPAVEMAGMSMLGGDGRPTTSIFTDDGAPEIDEAQYETGRGPCLDAWRTKAVIRLDDSTTRRPTTPGPSSAPLLAPTASSAPSRSRWSGPTRESGR